MEERDYDEFEFDCGCDNTECKCTSDEYDVCNWCIEEDCSGCGEFEFELEKDEDE